ncbi:MAG: SDR family oxidoreductase [Thermodesulfobacteriota bacterium]|nr:SDR family oxidoreductase [Thermodesulfobacteriota bacterium]
MSGIKKILVTGAGGFIGRALCTRMSAEGWHVRGTVRSEKDINRLPEGIEAVSIGSIDADTRWDDALRDIDTVVHLAARVHVMDDTAVNRLEAFRKMNVVATKHFAQSASSAGVRRFIFMSSIKVNGEGRETAYTEDDEEAPEDPYGVSKWEAEQQLRKIADMSGLETVILRPPLVYGPGVKANFLRLVSLVKFGIPLPFGCIKNRRSLIYIGNLIDTIITCMTNTDAAGKTYLVSDGEDVSTPELIRRIGAASGRRTLLLPVPVWIIRMAGRISGKHDEVERLVGSLTVDISKIYRELEWEPPYSMEHGLRETLKWYQKAG